MSSPRRQSAMAIVNGFALACSNCERELSIKDVAADRAYCKANGLPDPSDDELLCTTRAKCHRIRKSQAEDVEKDEGAPLFDEGREIKSIEAPDTVNIYTTKRRDQDGRFHDEKPVVDVVLTKYDLMDDEGKPRRPARSDQEILRDLLDKGLEPRCKLHGTPGCGTCKSVQQSRDYAAAHANDPPPVQTPRPEPAGPSIDSVLKAIKGSKEIQAIAKEVHQIVRQRPVKRREYKKKSEPKELPNLRKQYGYTSRQLADCLDEPGFNGKVLMTDVRLLLTEETPPGWDKKSWRQLHAEITNGERHANNQKPRTLKELFNMLPMRRMILFSHGQIEFYKDYAAGNRTIDELQDRIAQGVYAKRGFEEPDYLIRLENEIIRRAWDRLLLPLPAGSLAHDLDFEAKRDDEFEKIVQGLGAGAETIGGSILSQPGRRLTSFDHVNGGITRHRDGGGGGDSSRGTAHDDYGEDSVA
jgi:hypothetical protein